MVEFPNINYIFLPKNSTAITQPLDCSVFACVKNKYASWLMKKYMEVGPENVTMEQRILSYASIFNGLDVVSGLDIEGGTAHEYHRKNGQVPL